MRNFLCLFGIALSLVGCTESNSTPQDNVCDVQSLSGIQDKCKSGEVVYFEPSSWGNEQLPLLFTALACDTNKPVYFNNGGVVCTFVIRKSINGKSISDNEQETTSKKDSSNSNKGN